MDPEEEQQPAQEPQPEDHNTDEVDKKTYDEYFGQPPL